jgi:16S rRNA (cytosine967-C5)-methyltransferase
MVRWWRYINDCCPNDESSLNYFHLFATWQILKDEDLPEWDDFVGIDKEAVLGKAEEQKLVRKSRESIPDWLDELAVSELGEDVWGKELHELNKEAPVVLRANRAKTTIGNLKHSLSLQEVEVDYLNNDDDVWSTVKKSALVLTKRKNLDQVKAFKEGFFEIQDASSQLIANFLQLEEGMTIIDACAGAGGKSLHIASTLKNKGQIIALDVSANKLTELKKRADRAGVNIIVTQEIDTDTIKNLENSADRLLLDVPCSGLGVLKRNPDAKWKLTKDFIDKVKGTQQSIIKEYSIMLKPGGIMVYATCSILPSENEGQVNAFLKSNDNFELIEQQSIMPSQGFDGFYMAALKKK